MVIVKVVTTCKGVRTSSKGGHRSCAEANELEDEQSPFVANNSLRFDAATCTWIEACPSNITSTVMLGTAIKV